MRGVLELAGYENMLSKIVGSNNKLNNALTTIKALSSYKHAAHFNKMIAEPVEAEEAIEEIRHQLTAIEVNQDRLHQVEQQLLFIHDLARKHQVKFDDLINVQNKLKEQLANLQNADNIIQQMNAEFE